MSKRAAEALFHLLKTFDKPLICTASGASPAGLYKELIHLVNTSAINSSSWYFVGLDEWQDMNGNDEGSSRHQLNQQLFHPLNVPEQQICFFDGKATDLEKECRRAEDFIAQHGPIAIAILGIGVNGHIGMNEPGTPASIRSHVAAIHPGTQQIGQKYFKEPKQLDTGITLGLATLLEAKHLLLLASGTNKAESIFRMLHAPITEDLPASLLRDHPSLHIYLDKEAAGLLK
ncbi:MAG TPA: glucosamine-6-phosphate deaminase [Flavisolibacter sp.]|nr:glucosamine-6-phosphate deaminase [Flavisolibacter sp.]